jgi:photosystem II stability/assembly factor-like uncharacterized protein
MGVSEDLRSGCFRDAATGFIGGSGGLLLRTDDSGKTWKKIPVPDTAGIRDIVFSTPAKGFATGGFNFIRITSDSGKTWSKLDLSELNPGVTNSICFPTENVGYVITAWAILRTENGGTTWSFIPGLHSGATTLADGFFLSADTGFFVSPYYGTIYKTVDQGTTVMSGPTTMSRAITFLTHRIGYTITRNNKCFRTADQGAIWEPENALPAPDDSSWDDLSDVSAIGNKAVLVVGKKGDIARKVEDAPTGLQALLPSPHARGASLPRRRVDGRALSGSKRHLSIPLYPQKPESK